MTIGALTLITLVILYFLPALVAGRRKHKDSTSIAILNVLFGWTFIGWGIALIWAFKKD
ncbi:superinfection immunity protein [Paraburkholderia humisilvae]|uniref:Superinfection immunity protein n=1 Tax=Paraburkholderia humisilvae TaxID=627669 RepID=A0A6J5DXB9_9BURK|nr:superinfection immunity protein [Paraburkholderia humisilvae]CAB3758643.1 hypothetical protein LMG29542_03394 [Paraburkholderia humisilvae]